MFIYQVNRIRYLFGRASNINNYCSILMHFQGFLYMPQKTSEKGCELFGRTTPIKPLLTFLLFFFFNNAEGSYSNCSAILIICFFFSESTYPFQLKARETVPVPTPAAFATSLIVAIA